MSNMVIQTNVLALNSHRSLKDVGNLQGKASARLSSGYKINSAADDAAGLAISEKMRAQIRGLDMASKNSQDAISLIQTAEGGMQEVDNMLQRIRELVNYASNDTQEHNTTGSGDRQKIQDEINQLVEEIDSMANRVEFNKKKVINGDYTLTQGSVDGTAISNALSNAISDAILGSNTTISNAVDTAVASAVSDAKVAQSAALSAASALITTTSNAYTTASDVYKPVGDLYAAASNNLASAASALSAASVGAVTLTDAQSDLKVVTDMYENLLDTFKATVTGLTTNFSSIYSDISDISGAASNASALSAISDVTASDNVRLSALSDLKSNLQAAATMNGSNLLGINLGTLSDANGPIDISSNADIANISKAISDLTSSTMWSDAFSNYAKAITGVDDMVQKIAYDQASNAFVDVGAINTASVGTYNTASDNYANAVSDYNKMVSDLTDTATTTASNAVTNKMHSDIASDVTLAQLATITSNNTTATTGKGLYFQVGANADQGWVMSIGSVDSLKLGIGNGSGVTSINVLEATGEDITGILSDMDTALSYVTSERSKLGAAQNRLEYTIKSLEISSENLAAAESRIRDTDMAKEMMNFTKANVLQQAATSMLAQANQAPQNVLQLLR